ncbi:MAG: gamma-glutamyltransferase [Azospirillaceae bacterium]
MKQLCRFIGSLAMVMALTGCVSPTINSGRVDRYAALSDDALAAAHGLEILERGGTAADAVLAMAMLATVTTPSRASLGGGGACLVMDPPGQTIRALDFPALPAGEAMVPGYLRGFALLHAEYGRLRWPDLLAEAEDHARLGDQYSALYQADQAFGAAAPNRADYAETLARIRTASVAAFYQGEIGRRYAEAMSGDPAFREAIIGYQPQWSAPATVEIGYDTLAFGPNAGMTGTRLAQAWPADAGGDGPPALGFAAFSPNDQAIVCAVSLGGYGDGVAAGDTGIVPQRRQDEGGFGLALGGNEPRGIAVGFAWSANGTRGLNPAVAAFLDDEDVTPLVQSDFAVWLSGLLCEWDRERERTCRVVLDAAAGGGGAYREDDR